MSSLNEADRHRVSNARLAAADAVAELAHALVAFEADDDVLAELAAQAGALRARLVAGAPRIKPDDGLTRWEHARPDGAELSCFADCMIAGPANPLAAGGQARREGDEAVLRVVLRPGFEGLPGRSHGGIVASLFDEVMGQALYMDGTPAYTAWLRVDFRAAVPVGEPLELRARVRSREGRKCVIDATLYAGGEPGPTAEALFIVPREHAG